HDNASSDPHSAVFHYCVPGDSLISGTESAISTDFAGFLEPGSYDLTVRPIWGFKVGTFLDQEDYGPAASVSGTFHFDITFGPIRPDLVAASLSWNSSSGGVDFQYA